MYDIRHFKIRILENNVINKKRLFNFVIRIKNDYPVASSEKMNFMII